MHINVGASVTCAPMDAHVATGTTIAVGFVPPYGVV